MKQISERARLDDSGQLWGLFPGKYDSFAPLGTLPADEWKPIGVMYESVPTYSWPLSLIWENNTLQFLSQADAVFMVARMGTILGEDFDIVPYDEEVRVGPFTWATKRMARIKGVEEDNFCLGLEAATWALNPEHYAASLRSRVK